jgi:hypothetical protein
MLKSTRRQSRVRQIAIAAVDLLWMPDAIEPGLVSEPVDVANISGTVRVAEFTS